MFIHLHNHSHYSLLDGLPKIDELLDLALEYKMNALALTDHGTMYGAIEFYKKAQERGIKPILGLEIYLAPEKMTEKKTKDEKRFYHLLLLAKNKQGYKNLMQISTAGHLKGFYYKPRIDHHFLKKHKQGLIASSACLQGEIPQNIIKNNLKKAEELVQFYHNLFGKENFYLELQHHPHLPEQEKVNYEIIELAKKYKIPLIATADTHYLRPKDAEAQEILLCLQTKKTLKDQNRKLSMIGEDFSFKPPEEMEKLFHDLPQALENTEKISRLCQLEIKLGQIKLPYYPLPEKKTEFEVLKELCEKGLKMRYSQPWSREVEERLNYELKIIQQTGFAGYFLIVQDFVNWAKKQGIIVGPGRGSAPGSLVSYLLNITDLDPLQYDLLFERFLNPERITMPDIDLDFADHRRDEVIEYVKKKYGKNHVAQIITFGTMAARAAVRDAGRVLGYPYEFCDKLAKLIPMFKSIDEALALEPELKEKYNQDQDVQKIIDTAKKLEGVARHASTHACGIVITKKPLKKTIPLQFASASDKTVVTQYEMHTIEDLGLLKMDFLGLKNLTIIEEALKIIEKIHHKKINISNIPLDDAQTFQLLSAVKTTGVFQLESSGMRRYLKELKPSKIEDLIAMVALYRPGPMEYISDYIQGKHRKRKIKYLHPKLKPILEKTYGVAIYQEQILQMARDLAGFTLGEADILRRAIGKKIKELLEKQREKFIKGCINNGISQGLAKKLFSFIEPFARYGFNRSHAACYAMIAYQTAYLKAHFPACFMAALLTADHGSTDRLGIEIQEAQTMGIKILPPDVNESFKNFTVVQKNLNKPSKTQQYIRFGLGAIKNVGENVVEKIIEERKKNGPYQSLENLLTRAQCKDLNKKSIEALAMCGALDCLNIERKKILFNIERILSFMKREQKLILSKQNSLFAHLKNFEVKLNLEEIKPAETNEKLKWEKELLGVYLSAHPMQEYKKFLERHVSLINELALKQAGQTIRIAGVISKVKKIFTKNGEQMVFATLEDTTKETEALIFPKLFKETKEVWVENNRILLQGKISDKDGEIKILAEKVWELNQKTIPKISALSALKTEPSQPPSFAPSYAQEKNNLQAPLSKNNQITIKILTNVDLFLLNRIKKILQRFPGAKVVYLEVPNAHGYDKIKTKIKVEDRPKLKQEIEKLGGVLTIG